MTNHYLPEREADIAAQDEAAMKLALAQREMKAQINDELEGAE